MTVMTKPASPGLETEELRDALDTVISIPVVPFRNGEVDFEGHATNVDYLMNTNNLEGDRRRAIAVAGTSLVHHISCENQVRLMDIAGERMAGRGVLMAGIAPNPLPDAARLIETMSGLEYAPDVYLVMPLTGIVQPAGLYGTYMEFAEKAGECGARLLYYLRSPEQIPYVARLVNDSPHFIGVKVGTRDEDVAPLVEQIDRRRGMVIWGIGDRSTRAAQFGATGHTSGINIAFSRASDEINNAQRRGDYEVSQRVEGELAALEEIRFRDGRMYNYSAVVEAMHAGGWLDVAAGEGGPFNPRVPAGVAGEVRAAIEGIRHYH